MQQSTGSIARAARAAKAAKAAKAAGAAGGSVDEGQGSVIVRERVNALLDSLAERRLACVIGDSASGKTVAVRCWAERRDDPVVHLAVVPGRDRPRTLLSILVDVTEPLCPGLRTALGPELDAQAAGVRADDPIELAAVLAGALASAWGEYAFAPFTVVVDDFDAVQDSAGVAFFADLIRLYPRSVHMIVVARSTPPFALHRLDAAGEYGEVGPRALRFDADETHALFARAGIALEVDQARTIAEACGGWAGGLRLGVESALTHGVADLGARLATSGAASFLAAVAFRPLDGPGRAVVRMLSVLGRLDREVTQSKPEIAGRLEALADRGVLVSADAAGWSLTALARYAVDSAMPPDPHETLALLAEGVELALTTDRPEDALTWAVRHGDPALVRATLDRVGWRLLDSGNPVLTAAADCLSVPVGDLGTDGLLASYFASRGNMPLALDYLGGVASGLALPVAIGWRVATALWMHGDAAVAQDILARVRGTGEPADEAQLAAAQATLAWGRGDGVAARRHADEALHLARACADEAALGVAWVTQGLVAALEGDLGRNQRCYSTALTHAAAARDVLTQLRVRCNVGSRLTEIGRHRDAVSELDEALRLGEATGQRTRIALARLNQGQARLGLGQIDEALRDVEVALAIWDELESPMAAFAHQTRGDVLARRGDPTRASSAFRAAMAAAERQHDAQTLVPAAAGLARCLVSDDPDEAARLADRARAEPAALGSVVALLARGWIALLAADRPLAAHCARSARNEAARRDDPASLAQALVLDVLAAAAPSPADARLSEAQALMDEVGDQIALAELDVVVGNLHGDRPREESARARLRALGVRDSSALIAGPLAVLHEQRRTVVTIRTLGSFAVRLGEQTVPASAWQSRKARDLVKILVARRGKAITRDALAELLWPDNRGDASGNRLSVALSTARAVFDPGKTLPADHVVVADRDAVRLNVRSVWVDLDHYLALVEAALAAADTGSVHAAALLERAAAAYGGDFCEEDPYETWAAQPRDELRARHHQVLRTLAATLMSSGRPDDAVPWLIALLGTDQYDEPTHLRLIGTLARAGRHGEARRSYRTYVERMADIDVEPAAFPQPARR